MFCTGTQTVVFDVCVCFFFTQDDQIVVLDMSAAFSSDGLANSHPIKIPIERPEEINQIFDSITYEKVSVQNMVVYEADGKSSRIRTILNKFNCLNVLHKFQAYRTKDFGR